MKFVTNRMGNFQAPKDFVFDEKLKK